jgi:hypothetical protein
MSILDFDDLTVTPTFWKNKIDPTLENIFKAIYRGSSLHSGPWVAGGMGRELAVNPASKSFADIDIWFSSPESYAQCMSNLTEAFGNWLHEDYASDNAITYKIGEYKVQLIRREYYPSLEKVFEYFDFTCCQIAVAHDFSLYGPGIDDARNRILKLNKLDTVGFLARYGKYLGYGYKMPNEEFLDIIENKDINYEFDATTLGY